MTITTPTTQTAAPGYRILTREDHLGETTPRESVLVGDLGLGMGLVRAAAGYAWRAMERPGGPVAVSVRVEREHGTLVEERRYDGEPLDVAEALTRWASERLASGLHAGEPLPTY